MTSRYSERKLTRWTNCSLLLHCDLNVLRKQPAFGEKGFLCVSLFIPTFDRLAPLGWRWLISWANYLNYLPDNTHTQQRHTQKKNAASRQARARARGRARSASSNESLNKDGWLTPDGLSRRKESDSSFNGASLQVQCCRESLQCGLRSLKCLQAVQNTIISSNIEF